MKHLFFFISLGAMSAPLQAEMPDSSAAQQEQQRRLFIQVEHQISSASPSQVERWLTELQDYPLQPYLKQRWLQRRISQHDDIARFLEQHQGFVHFSFHISYKSKCYWYLTD